MHAKLRPTKPRALGLSDHSLGLSCARPVLTRSQAELAFERPGEIRKIIEADGVGDFLGQCTLMGEAFARPLQPVAQQMLAEACALLLAEDAAELGWAEPAQGGNILQRDLAVEMRRHMCDGRMRFPVPARAIRFGIGKTMRPDCAPRTDPAQSKGVYCTRTVSHKRFGIAPMESHSAVRPARPVAGIGQGGEQKVFWGCQRRQGPTARRAGLDPDG